MIINYELENKIKNLEKEKDSLKNIFEEKVKILEILENDIKELIKENDEKENKLKEFYLKKLLKLDLKEDKDEEVNIDIQEISSNSNKNAIRSLENFLKINNKL